MDGERVGGLIDFYFACNDAFVYDLAITLNDWCMGAEQRLDTARAQAMLNAYQSVRPLTQTEVDIWPMTLRVAALRFWISRLYDLHLPRDGEMVTPHDPDHFKRILQNHIASAQPVLL